MSHGPFGLGGAALDPVPDWQTIVNVAPSSVNASASLSTLLIFIFMSSLSASPGFSGV
jgi:hypothetical protein